MGWSTGIRNCLLWRSGFNQAHTVRFLQSSTIVVHDPSEILGKSRGTLCGVRLSNAHLMNHFDPSGAVDSKRYTSGATKFHSPPELLRLRILVKGINHLMVHAHHAKTSYLHYRNCTILKFVSGGKIIQFEPDLKIHESYFLPYSLREKSSS